MNPWPDPRPTRPRERYAEKHDSLEIHGLLATRGSPFPVGRGESEGFCCQVPSDPA